MSAVLERPVVPARDTTATRRLLAGGAVAGPLFLGVALVQVLTRDGFDLGRHPISLLSVGDHGWIQIANFIVAGALSIGLAVGLRRIRHGLVGPVLVGLYGAGLVVGGVFVADPGLGFPPGAPEGIPTEFSWHAMVHNVAPVVAFNAIIVACVVFAVRFARSRSRAWAAYSLATGLVALAVVAWPTQAGISWRLAVAITLTFTWQTALALHLARHHDV